jgi:hypothetical protein
MSVHLEASYKVAEKAVKLTVIIGDAQLGVSRVLLEGKEIGRGAIRDLLVGMGSKLVGKTLEVKSVVTDVNDKTNHTSVTYELKGGAQDNEFYLEGDVGKNGDSIIYRATVNFER